MKPFTAISLFAGAVDGLGIAATKAGFNVTHHIEWDAWCCEKLHKNFPQSVIIQEDIKNVVSLPDADVVIGSPPCQGWSSAGDGRGLHDSRNLWPDMLRLLKQSRPRCVVVENVSGGIAKGYIDLVCGGLEAAGYAAQALVYPAAIFGAPHNRERVIVVGHDVEHANRKQRLQSDVATRTDNMGYAHWRSDASRRNGLREPGMVGSNDGITRQLAHMETFAGFPNYKGLPQHAHEPPRTITDKVPEHKKLLEAWGNAIVWQQVYPIMRAVHRFLVAAALPASQRDGEGGGM